MSESYSIRLGKVLIDAIKPSKDLETLDAEELEKSIGILGMINPVTVDEDTMEIITGNTRFAANKKLGKKEIYAILIKFHDDVSAEERKKIKELIRLDEKLVRKKLSPIDECVSLLQEKRLYEGLHPETKVGGLPGKLGGGKGAKNEKFSSFAEDIARKKSINKRTIQYKIEIGRQLEDLKPKIEHIPRVNQLTELRKLGRMEDRTMQEMVLDKIQRGEARTVDAAIASSSVPAEILAVETPNQSSETSFDIRYEDFQSTSIGSSSVGLMISAGGFPRNKLGSWNDLGKFAHSVLRPGGFFAIILENELIPIVLRAFQHNKLRYVAISGIFSTAGRANLEPVVWKPVLIMANGKPKIALPTFSSLIVAPKSPDNRLSVEVASKFISMFTGESDLVLVPIANSTFILEAAEKLGCKAVGLRPLIHEKKRKGIKAHAEDSNEIPKYTMA